VNKSNILNPVLHSMAEAYQRQLVKYKAMLKLAEKQRKCVEKEEIDKLEEVIGARQYIIKELDEMNSNLKPLRDDIMMILGLKEFSSSAILKAVPTKAAQELADTLSELGEILYSLKEMDVLNEQMLRNKLAQVKTELEGVNNKKQAEKAYNSIVNKQPSNFFDKSK